jgi:hypothetical protein
MITNLDKTVRVACLPILPYDPLEILVKYNKELDIYSLPYLKDYNYSAFNDLFDVIDKMHYAMRPLHIYTKKFLNVIQVEEENPHHISKGYIKNISSLCLIACYAYRPLNIESLDDDLKFLSLDELKTKKMDNRLKACIDDLISKNSIVDLALYD